MRLYDLGRWGEEERERMSWGKNEYSKSSLLKLLPAKASARRGQLKT